MAQKCDAGNVLVCRVRIRKVNADIPQGCSTKKGITEGMEKNISVGMTFEPFCMGDFYATENQFSPLYQSMDIVSKSSSWDVDIVTVCRSE